MQTRASDGIMLGISNSGICCRIWQERHSSSRVPSPWMTRSSTISCLIMSITLPPAHSTHQSVPEQKRHGSDEQIPADRLQVGQNVAAHNTAQHQGPYPPESARLKRLLQPEHARPESVIDGEI